MAARTGGGSLPGGIAQQAQAVEADDDGGALVPGHPQRQRQLTEAQLRSANPTAYPALTRNLDLLANNAFLVRWDSGRDRPMDLSFETALDVLIRGLRAKRE
jgi:hypothetical protein